MWGQPVLISLLNEPAHPAAVYTAPVGTASTVGCLGSTESCPSRTVCFVCPALSSGRIPFFHTIIFRLLFCEGYLLPGVGSVLG